MTAVAIIHREEILEQVRAGYILREIAPQYGVSPQAIHKQLRNDPEYRAALPVQANSMIEESKEATWGAREQIDIARAREMSRFAFRYAEAVDPGTWAPHSHVTVKHTSDLGERLRRAKERVIGNGGTSGGISDSVSEESEAKSLVYDPDSIPASGTIL